MYSSRPGLILGFHGCDKKVADKIVQGVDPMRRSENAYDWLGHGMYFWEHNPERALDFAKFLKDHPERVPEPIEKPAVLGAVIDLGFCLDLLNHKYLQLLKLGYALVQTAQEASGWMPENKKAGGSEDLLLKELDCRVIETLHKVREDNKDRSFDSVRGAFMEGKEIYPNAGFKEKNHIQICIRNPNCIKGFFHPLELHSHHPRV